MASYLVAYDLLKEDEHDYQNLWDELESLGGHRTQFSLWLVASSKSAQGLHNQLKAHMHEKDRLWVAEFHTDRHWFSNAIKGTNDWINSNPPRTCS